MPTGHPSNAQGVMAAQVAAAKAGIAKAANARAAAKKQAEDTAKTKKLNDSISRIQSSEIDVAQFYIKSAEKTINEKQKELTAYVTAHESEVGYPSDGFEGSDTDIIENKQLAIVNANNAILENIKKIKDSNDKIAVIKKQIYALHTIINGTIATTGSPGAINNGTNGTLKGKKSFSKYYTYNAPMVKSAYFGSGSFQDNILGNNRVDKGAYTDARDAWKGVKGGRGTIQMDDKLIQASDKQLNTQSDNLDTTKYGFKFLYNPTTVSMAWGLMNYMDPPYEASGADVFTVVSAGLMTSTVDFELILNRIEDFNYLNENGLSGISPYGVDVPLQDQRDIYRKGTMYDMEYLLKTLNGPSAPFKSALNDWTSDRSWLRPTIVELHLGSALRYRVRIANLSINHIMFNSRMVPILSSVKITCSRFNDGPTAMNTSGKVNDRSGQRYGISDPAKLKALGLS